MVGLKTYIDSDTGITKVQIDGFSSDIPRTMLLKLKVIIDKKNNVKVNNRKAFRNIVLDIAEKHAKNLTGNSKLDPYLAYEIRRAR
jgi:hypothetical protein